MDKTANSTDKFLAKRLQAFRQAQGMSQESLARAMELPLDVVARLESGALRFDATMIAKAGSALGVGAFSLFDADPKSAGANEEDLEHIRLACVSDLMEVSDPLTLRLVITLLWIMREDGVAGLSALSEQARSLHRPQH